MPCILLGLFHTHLHFMPGLEGVPGVCVRMYGALACDLMMQVPRCPAKCRWNLCRVSSAGMCVQVELKECSVHDSRVFSAEPNYYCLEGACAALMTEIAFVKVISWQSSLKAPCTCYLALVRRIPKKGCALDVLLTGSTMPRQGLITACLSGASTGAAAFVRCVSAIALRRAVAQTCARRAAL